MNERENTYFEALVRGEITDEQYESALKGKEWIVGARVRLLNGLAQGRLQIGEIGTIVKIGSYISVGFDRFFDGHDCEGNAKYGHGWNIEKCHLELI